MVTSSNLSKSFWNATGAIICQNKNYLVKFEANQAKHFCQCKGSNWSDLTLGFFFLFSFFSLAKASNGFGLKPANQFNFCWTKVLKSKELCQRGSLKKKRTLGATWERSKLSSKVCPGNNRTQLLFHQFWKIYERSRTRKDLLVQLFVVQGGPPFGIIIMGLFTHIFQSFCIQWTLSKGILAHLRVKQKKNLKH